MKLGTETGSLINHIMTESVQKIPTIGDGATECLWSDRHAGTIVNVVLTKSGKLKEVHWQRDVATRIDNNGMSDCQQYCYTPNTSSPIVVFKLTKKGLKSEGSTLVVGTRKEHYDYSF